MLKNSYPILDKQLLAIIFGCPFKQIVYFCIKLCSVLDVARVLFETQKRILHNLSFSLHEAAAISQTKIRLCGDHFFYLIIDT